MGTEGVARVAGVCHDLALAEAKLIGAKLQRHGKGLLGVLFLTNQLGNLGQEAVEMAVHGGIAIVVSEVQRIAIATGSDRHLGDVAIGNGKQRLAHHTLGLEVETSVEVVGAELTEVTTQIEREVERCTEAYFLATKRHPPKEQPQYRHQNETRTVHRAFLLTLTNRR